MERKEKIKEIVINSLKKLGKEEMIDGFINANKDTKIQESVDSMAIVVLSVDIEEGYKDVFDKEIKVLNDQDPNFLTNFRDVSTLVEYINKL
ncbi:hypothetical protein [Galbibacter pacificus]|uniref:Carrier domain-containing protein n=1 Tax=Galbibacter pacificus TaxID=2996052 RepID=A0ABT6FND4_9FLAO|nr:hypothetical protein [Galbibacter pacificus]MDG3581299.1 hypothetical protein [Galbibacter pacificus]MDG3584777.1 hypothetical protein [Galbibacter pacificus]